jgi:hypothetical protein
MNEMGSPQRPQRYLINPMALTERRNRVLPSLVKGIRGEQGVEGAPFDRLTAVTRGPRGR